MSTMLAVFFAFENMAVPLLAFENTTHFLLQPPFAFEKMTVTFCI